MKKIALSILAFVSFLYFGIVSVSAEEAIITDDVLSKLTYNDFSAAKEIFDEKYDESTLSVAEKDNIAIELLIDIADQKSEVQTYALPDTYDRLNAEEKRLVVLHPGQALTVYSMSNIATRVSITYFRDGNHDNNNGNAFRHAYWNALLTIELGYNNAEMWGTAHEYGQSGLGTTMDLQNNEEGRQAGEMVTTFYNNLYGRKPTYAEVRNAIFSRVDRGQLVRVVNGKLIPTDSSDNILR